MAKLKAKGGKLRLRIDKSIPPARMKRAIERAKPIIAREMAEDIAETLVGKYPPASQPDTTPHNRTFTLKGSIKGVVRGGKIRLQMARYGVYLEKGTRKMAKRPFVAPIVGKRRLWGARLNQLVTRFVAQDERRSKRRK
jgi:hypothetical protein